MRKLLAALASFALAAALVTGGCSSPCQDLADRICNCVAAGGNRDNCTAAVKNQLSNGTQRPSATDETYCQEKLASCGDSGGDLDAGVCRALQTTSGKVACGLAFDPDAGLPDAGAPDGGTP